MPTNRLPLNKLLGAAENTLITTVTKIDAARRQLKTAIELWFANGDAVSINTLAGAAHQIIHDLNHKEKNAPLILDRPEFTKEQRKMFATRVKSSTNFFKHAERRDGAESISIEFDNNTNELYISMATQGLKQMGYIFNGHEFAFCAWEAIHRPEVLNEESMQLLKSTISNEATESLKNISRKEFLSYVLPVFNQTMA